MSNPMGDYLEGFERNAARGGWSPDAFHCDRCPKAGCPLWWKLEWETPGDDGVVRARTSEGCGAAMAPALLTRLLIGQQITHKMTDARLNDVAVRQDKVVEGAKASLAGILQIVARLSGNPEAIAAAPWIPKVLKAAKNLLPGKKKGS